MTDLEINSIAGGMFLYLKQQSPDPNDGLARAEAFDVTEDAAGQKALRSHDGTVDFFQFHFCAAQYASRGRDNK